MVIGYQETPAELTAPAPTPAASAWALVEATQRNGQLPCLLVPQPAHAVLAGELAEALLPEVFGELPGEVLRAIQMHDTGWAGNDAQQIVRLRSKPGRPVAFVAVSAAETIDAWTASIDTVEGLTRVGALIVSRHFCLLAQDDEPLHRNFKQGEAARRQRLAAATLATGETAGERDLERWTAALGFCDLLSLYLVSGLQQEVALPLAHPADRAAAQAATVTLQIDGGYLHFSPPTLQAESQLQIQGLLHPVPTGGARAATLNWEVE